jgi:hypothetical protein
MKPLLVVILSTALVPLLSVPAFAQTATDDQYDGPTNDDPSTSIGHEAADDALEASEAFDPGPEGSASGSEVGESADGSASGSEAIASEVGESADGSVSGSADGSASESGDSATSESDAGEPEVDSAEGGTAENGGGGSGDSVAATGSSEAAAELPEDPAELSTITRLPKTGGLSPLSLGVVLVVGGLLVRGVAGRALGC